MNVQYKSKQRLQNIYGIIAEQFSGPLEFETAFNQNFGSQREIYHINRYSETNHSNEWISANSLLKESKNDH
jgi:hypothetical protein